jgi:ABC-type sugar transport system permease subunit
LLVGPAWPKSQAFVQLEEDVMIASSDRLLRRALWVNAVFSVVSGAVGVAFATPFAAWATHAPLSVAGLDLAVVFELLGTGVVLFGAICGWAASRETVPQGWARVILVADIAWVAASALVLVLPAPWTTAGIAGIVVVALIVADIAILEYLGLRRLGAAH